MKVTGGIETDKADDPVRPLYIPAERPVSYKSNSKWTADREESDGPIVVRKRMHDNVRDSEGVQPFTVLLTLNVMVRMTVPRYKRVQGTREERRGFNR